MGKSFEVQKINETATPNQTVVESSASHDEAESNL
jgi:hypothetical protein